jgi:2,5-diamino-6-(ribosylamino)-4(3H)-pyrimidinone 5'-phosphate reductase
MKPFIKLNVAISIDGKITTAARDFHGFGGSEDRERMDGLRAWSDAIVIGAGTLRDEDPLLLIGSPERIEIRRLQEKTDQPLPVIVSRNLDFEAQHFRIFRERINSVLVFTSSDAPKQNIQAVEKFADVKVLQATEDGLVNLMQLCSTLSEIGVQHLLVEGGGELNYLMLKSGLIDELHVTIAPLVIGGRLAPSAFSGNGFLCQEVVRLALLDCVSGNDGTIFLHFQVVHR